MIGKMALPFEPASNSVSAWVHTSIRLEAPVTRTAARYLGIVLFHQAEARLLRGMANIPAWLICLVQ